MTNQRANCDAIIVGAGPAGLACAASLRNIGLATVIVEKADHVASVWRRHYDRLHLHTDRNHSALPGMAMPKNYPTYPSRDEVIAYLESYAAQFEIRPCFGRNVRSITHDSDLWRIDAGETFVAPIVIVATGTADFPHRPTWPGLETFHGTIVHSANYRNPTPYLGKRVLVVGFGNSGGEIALDLADAGVDVALAVRSPVQVLPRDLLGFPILSWAILYKRLPARMVDRINAPILRMALGRMERLGLQLSRKGPRQMVEEDGRVPLIDIGTLAGIRDGRIAVRGAIDALTPDGVLFARSGFEPFDAIILATGFRPDLRPLLPGIEGVFDPRGVPLQTGRTTGQPGLYFCGQIPSPTGQLREIGIEARRIASLAKAYISQRYA